MLNLQTYVNKDEVSPVIAYAIETESIIVQFTGGTLYRYSVHMLGRETIDEMKARAMQGHGLAGFINRNARKPGTFEKVR